MERFVWGSAQELTNPTETLVPALSGKTNFGGNCRTLTST